MEIKIWVNDEPVNIPSVISYKILADCQMIINFIIPDAVLYETFFGLTLDKVYVEIHNESHDMLYKITPAHFYIDYFIYENDDLVNRLRICGTRIDYEEDLFVE